MEMVQWEVLSLMEVIKLEGYKTTPVAEKTDGDVKITADGTAVKNVYFARATYTITFMRWNSRKWSGRKMKV